MPEPTDQTPENVPTHSWQWAMSYLREDIQDLRNDTREIHKRIDDANRRMDTRFNWAIGTTLSTTVAILGVMAALTKR